MLVLSRHRDESIIIGDDIVITVVDIRGDKVRLGIAAPIEISVHRQEVYEAIQRENRQASRLDPQDARQLEHLNPPIRRDIRRPRTEGRLRPRRVERDRARPVPSPRQPDAAPGRTRRSRLTTGALARSLSVAPGVGPHPPRRILPAAPRRSVELDDHVVVVVVVERSMQALPVPDRPRRPADVQRGRIDRRRRSASAGRAPARPDRLRGHAAARPAPSAARPARRR